MALMLQPRRVEPLKMLWVGGILVALFAFAWCRRGPARAPAGTPPADAGAAATVSLDGETMGTTYSIRFRGTGLSRQDVEAVSADIARGLARVNGEMSTYDPASDVARFSASRSTEPFPVSAECARVVRFSLELCARSGGAFDVTVAPLVNVWGFGSRGRRTEPPSEEEIRRVLPLIGYRRLSVTPAGALVKSIPDLQLDLSAVAKGYGVDAVSRVIESHGVTNFFVEIGGEVYASGHRPGGGAWRIGVDRPVFGAFPGEDFEGVLHLTNMAVATSGDYRNYIKDGKGEVFSHLFDPRTGRPAHRPQGSVSVLAADCMTADGLATALFVMGHEEGIPWLEKAYPQAEALFVVRAADGRFEEHATPGFAAHGGYRRGDE